jgi:molybdopterin synthase catalytic subunit
MRLCRRPRHNFGGVPVNPDIQLTSEVLVPETIISNLKKDDCGAIVFFIGTVRNTDNSGGKVAFLDIKKAGENALTLLQEVALQIQHKWHLRSQDIIIHRRTGKLAVGDIALVVAITAIHRQEAFAACAYAVDRIKEGNITIERDLTD